MMTLLEMELGVRVYVRKIDRSICGLFAYEESIGPCMLINANHSRGRRNLTAAHECGHLVSSRRVPKILHAEEGNSREERYADTFGRCFLIPARGMLQKFQDLTAGSDRLTRRHVIVLASAFGVSREAMVRRLEDLRLVKRGSWDWFSDNGGITDEQARQVLGDIRIPDTERADADRPTTMRLSLLAAEAYRQELMSEGQLARLLRLDRIELRAMLDGLELESDDGGEGVAILD
jgi:Zn-dependent peptidase ImmA (M78 family)